MSMCFLLALLRSCSSCTAVAFSLLSAASPSRARSRSAACSPYLEIVLFWAPTPRSRRGPPEVSTPPLGPAFSNQALPTGFFSSCLRQVPPPCQRSSLGGGCSNDGDDDANDVADSHGDDDDDADHDDEEEEEEVELALGASCGSGSSLRISF